MSFTTSIFLIGFLPWILLITFLLKKVRYSKYVILFLVNILFYIFGGVGPFIFVCIYSIAIWLFSILNHYAKNKWLFAFTLIAASFPLLVTKYTAFVIENINSLLLTDYHAMTLVIPIGISFFTFQGLSFLADSYMEKIEEKYSLLDVFLYLSFFVTVTSGPILRFNDFKAGIVNKAKNIDYSYGIDRIVFGLTKKVLIADKIAVIADYYFNGVSNGNSYSFVGLIIGSIAYSLQLYFDFSGYSDIAIGIGYLLGFSIPENFDHPYLANSISNFWRRWHISLSQWFRDYIYIPLGGNRVSVLRHIFNLFVVWLLTGIWHGSSWNFILWGLGYFMLLVIEKYIPFMKNIGKHWWGHIYSLFFINLLWVPFRADSLQTAINYLSGMFNFSSGTFIEYKTELYLPYILFAIILCLPWFKLIKKLNDKAWFILLKGVLEILLIVFILSSIVNSSYSPYIYGNF